MFGTAFLWLGLTVLFLAVEAMTVGLVSVWFAAGALIALIVSRMGASLPLQVIVFFAVSSVLLAMLRPFARKVIRPGLTATNVDSLIGTTGLVTAAIDNLSSAGQVKLGGMVWSARSTSGAPIPEGAVIRVDRIEGVKVLVSPAEVTSAV